MKKKPQTKANMKAPRLIPYTPEPCGPPCAIRGRRVTFDDGRMISVGVYDSSVAPGIAIRIQGPVTNDADGEPTATELLFAMSPEAAGALTQLLVSLVADGYLLIPN